MNLRKNALCIISIIALIAPTCLPRHEPDGGGFRDPDTPIQVDTTTITIDTTIYIEIGRKEDR